MDAGLQECDPQHNTQQYVNEQPHDPQAVQGDERDQTDNANGEGCAINFRGIKERDHQYRRDVIHDSEGGQKNLQAGGDAISQQGQDAQREGDVSGKGDGPAICNRLCLRSTP